MHQFFETYMVEAIVVISIVMMYFGNSYKYYRYSIEEGLNDTYLISMKNYFVLRLYSFRVEKNIIKSSLGIDYFMIIDIVIRKENMNLTKHKKLELFKELYV